jgi:hypothetical protein
MNKKKYIRIALRMIVTIDTKRNLNIISIPFHNILLTIKENIKQTITINPKINKSIINLYT